MILMRRLAILGLMLIASTSGAWAATSTEVFAGATISLNGLTLTVLSNPSLCTLSYAGKSACSSTDGIYLQGVAAGKDLVSFELVGASSGPAFSLAKGSTADASMSFQYTVTTDEPSTATFGNGSLTLNGTTSSSTTNKHVTAAEAFSANAPSAAPTGLTGFNLFLDSSATSQSAGPTGFTNSPELKTFTITDTINLTPSSIAGVSLISLVNTFHTAPEPASITVLLLGLGGLAFVRRRRAT
jgi:hypothetical protein